VALDPVTAIVDLANGVGSKLIERLWPDPAQQSAAKLELVKLQESGEIAKMANETDTVKAYLTDTQSARDRDKTFLNAGRKNWRGDILAFGALGALILCIIALFVADVPPQSRDLLLVTLGALVAIVKDVYGFEFGSSKDSQRNAQAVTDMLNSDKS
jgi:hypothetical protein